MKKRVYIAYTGGTIGMQKNARGAYEPLPRYLEEQMRAMPEFKDPQMPDYTLNEYEPLLDSSNMTPANWRRIAQDIQAHYADYDGFVVLHGTDTMAYTASALAFMLRGPKTIVITGSQIPLCETRTDARDNLLTSLLIAANPIPIPEVCLYFGGKLLRGCRSVKISADSFQAFESPNFPPLGTAGITIQINRELVLPPPLHPDLRVQEFQEPIVAALRLFPGISAKVIEAVLQGELHGLVLEAYGAGNGPTATPGVLDALRRATERGVVMVACTQCLSGRVDLGAYATSLASAGVISGFDMTAEAALAKLFYLFSYLRSPEEVKAEMVHNLRGELTA
jgi:L-asparaginase